jgi:pimeloyl-ACP methyl ester carboxylesterase
MHKPGDEGLPGTDDMKNYRMWGKPPYQVAVVHGGPGAPGSIAPVARELSKDMGVLEPLQTAKSVDGQVTELAVVLKERCDLPVTLVGWSWGATLSYLMTAHFPEYIRKLILLGTSSFEGKDGTRIDLTPIWMERFSEAEREKFLKLVDYIWDGKAEDKSLTLGKLFMLIAKAESYEQMPGKDDVLEYQLDVNIAIGLAVRELIEKKKLVGLGKDIKCPVTAIHGDYDPRSAEDIRRMLSGTIKDFRFILLNKCGHYPWMERYARDKFFNVLREEIAL